MLPVKVDTTPGLSEAARLFVNESKSANTRRAYLAGWDDFGQFCKEHGLDFLPAAPETVVEFLTDRAGRLSVSSLEIRLAAIAFAHGLARQPNPAGDAAVREVMSGIRRAIGRPAHKKTAITRGQLLRMTRALPTSPAGIRDRALLLLGFAGAFRRSELVGLDVADVKFVDTGMKVMVKRGKTDAAGHGLVKTIPAAGGRDLDPVTAVRAWLKSSGLKSGPLFRPFTRWGGLRASRLTDRSVALAVKAAAERAGMEAAEFAGHSLRSGFVTEAFKAGAHSWQVAELTGHKSERVLQGYIHAAGRGAAVAVALALGGKSR